MPFCDPINVPFVVSELQRLNPRSVIDVGCGMGGWGVVIREYLEFWYGRLERNDWHVRVEGVEIFERYRNPLWELYDRVHVGDALAFLQSGQRFDIGLCCDVIEHFRKDDGRRLLDAMLDSCDTVLLTTPISFWDDVGVVQQQNAHQRHLSLWGEKDFAGTTGKLVELGSTFAAVVSKSPTVHGPRMQKRYDDVGLGLLMRAAVRRVLLKVSHSAPAS